jgi:hypothetical protein
MAGIAPGSDLPDAELGFLTTLAGKSLFPPEEQENHRGIKQTENQNNSKRLFMTVKKVGWQRYKLLAIYRNDS